MGKTGSESRTAGGWLKRLLLQLVDGAVRDLRAIDSADDADAGLHRLRVRMKRAGALLRLGKAVLSKSARAELRGQMRAIKDDCAPQRDASVVAELAGHLGKKHGLHFVQPPKRVARPKAQNYRSRLARLRKGLCEASFDGLTWDDINEAYADCYKKGRRGMRTAGKSARAEDYHAWRKRVKALHCQMLSLHGSMAHLHKRLQRTQKLGHLLGCDHDLTLLEQETSTQAPGCPWQEIVAKERKKLRGRILKLGEKVYQQPPHRFARMRRLPME